MNSLSEHLLSAGIYDSYFVKGRVLNCDLVGTARALELPFAPPFLQPNASFFRGVNFASSGSGLLDSTSAGTVSAFPLIPPS